MNVLELLTNIDSYYKIPAPNFENIEGGNFSIKKDELNKGDKPFVLNWYNPLDRGIRESIAVPAEYVRENIILGKDFGGFFLISYTALLQYAERDPDCYYMNEEQRDEAMYEEYKKYRKAHKQKPIDMKIAMPEPVKKVKRTKKTESVSIELF